MKKEPKKYLKVNEDKEGLLEFERQNLIPLLIQKKNKAF
jgi:hypothetical protein